MSEFISLRGYTAGQLVTAKIQAQNSKGWSELSDANSLGIVAATSPTTTPSNF